MIIPAPGGAEYLFLHVKMRNGGTTEEIVVPPLADVVVGKITQTWEAESGKTIVVMEVETDDNR